MKVGFIGTGRMGGAMVRRLLDAKHDVGVYNRTPEKVKPLADAGAKILSARSPTPRATATSSTPCWPTTPRWKTSCSERGPARRAAEGRHPRLRRHPRHSRHPQDQGGPCRQGPSPGRRPDDGPAGARHRRHRRRVRLRPRRGDGQMQAAVRGARPQDLRGRRRSGGRDRHEDRQQFRARLRHGGDGRRLRAHAQIRRRRPPCSTT